MKKQIIVAAALAACMGVVQAQSGDSKAVPAADSGTSDQSRGSPLGPPASSSRSGPGSIGSESIAANSNRPSWVFNQAPVDNTRSSVFNQGPGEMSGSSKIGSDPDSSRSLN